jgi:negative regulator of flagellin synthesis FlgM
VRVRNLLAASQYDTIKNEDFTVWRPKMKVTPKNVGLGNVGAARGQLGADKLGKGLEEKAQLGESGDSAKIQLSDRARDLKRITELAMNAPDVNEDKVEKFRSLIDKGLYKIDAEGIADKMVNEQLMNSAMDDE